ncbi:MAG: hypothetical protein ABIN91_02935 [Mucilaginibacter sp.]|uniref:hypothetical protein n=1 Tax=Mucilaginibacter sp. TaxID=1882438 RepID=UPI003267290D
MNLTTFGKGYPRPVFNNAFFNDPNVYNAFGLALQEQYKAITQKIDAHFDPQEIASLKPQIKELKSKKGY